MCLRTIFFGRSIVRQYDMLSDLKRKKLVFGETHQDHMVAMFRELRTKFLKTPVAVAQKVEVQPDATKVAKVEIPTIPGSSHF